MRLPNNLCKDNRFQIRVVGMHSCTTLSFTMKSCLVHVSFLPLTSVAFPPLRNGWGGRNFFLGVVGMVGMVGVVEVVGMVGVVEVVGVVGVVGLVW